MIKDLKTITSSRPGQVRLIDVRGEQLGILDVAEALRIASTRGLDLVEVGPEAEPPVCKLMDYGKVKYQKSKKQKSSRRTQRKEVRLSVSIGEHDLITKTKQTEKFIEKGHEVAVTVKLKGREKAHPEVAVKTLKDFIERLEETMSIKVVKKPSGSDNKADTLLSKGEKNVVSKTERTQEGSGTGSHS